MDPQLIAYNTSMIEKAPKGIHDLAEMVKADPKKYENKITVRDPESSFGYSVTQAFTSENDAGMGRLRDAAAGHPP